MKTRLFVFVSIHAIALATSAAARTNETEVSTGPSTDRPYQLEAIVVSAPRLVPATADLTQEEMLDDARNLNAGHLVERVPGACSARASIDTPEPVIRGLGWERVSVQLDFLPLYGSCPARMDPPTVYLSPEAMNHLVVVQGLPSVTYGSGGTGGRVMARSVPNPTDPVLDGATALVSSTYNGGRDGATARAAGSVGNGTVEVGASLNAVDFSDYESGAGKTVPAENRSYGGGATIRWTPNENNGYWASWNTHRIDQLDYPALPMDATEVTSHTLTLGARHERFNQSLSAIEWQAGWSGVDHVMDNSQKLNRPMMEAEATTESQTIGGRLATEWSFDSPAEWIFGADGHYLTRDALRERRMVASGQTFYDPIWPDASQGQAGLFAERTTPLNQGGRLRLGLRVDGVSSAIGKGEEPLSPPVSSIAPTVRDGYAYFYGDEARDTDRVEPLTAGNALWEIPQGDRAQWFVGAGWVQRAASVTERFYSFAPAPGGYQVGNPSLDAETKGELDGGVEYHNDRMEIGARVFGAVVKDYILETGIASLDVNGDGADDLIRGFVNTDAALAGGEIEGRFILSSQWSVPYAAAYVRGRDVSAGEDLPLIPPLTGRVGVRWEWDRSVRPWAEAMLRAATAQERVDPRFPETETPGWQVVDLRGGCELPAGFSFVVGVENLLNQDYTEHLNRTAPLATGGLARGEKIPMPGRYFFASINWAM